MRVPGIPDEVELVKSFDEMRPGLPIWFLCYCSLGRHRSMVARLDRGRFLNPGSGQAVLERFASVHPQPARHPRPFGWPGFSDELLVNETAVAMGQVYRVVDPLMDNGDVNDKKRLQEEVDAVIGKPLATSSIARPLKAYRVVRKKKTS
jgi:hypothetical protein